MNLAGPRARAVLGALTDLDCSAEASSTSTRATPTVAGVPCLLLRIGFVGELGYEIHCPAAARRARLGRARSPAASRPFGLEPQRVLRLEKLHVIVGQDTDSESTPRGAGDAWIVKLDKEQDFIGRWALEHRDRGCPRVRLVGFSSTGGRRPRARSCSARRRRRRPVTSARRSAQARQVIGLARVPPTLAQDGARIDDLGRRASASRGRHTQPFYDPEGEVLRS